MRQTKYPLKNRLLYIFPIMYTFPTFIINLCQVSNLHSYRENIQDQNFLMHCSFQLQCDPNKTGCPIITREERYDCEKVMEEGD